MKEDNSLKSPFEQCLENIKEEIEVKDISAGDCPFIVRTLRKTMCLGHYYAYIYNSAMRALNMYLGCSNRSNKTIIA